VRAIESIRDSVVSFNEAKIERERAESERKKVRTNTDGLNQISPHVQHSGLALIVRSSHLQM
jgi:hypothetical protein